MFPWLFASFLKSNVHTLCCDGRELFCVSEFANPAVVSALQAAQAMTPSLGLDFPTQAEARRAYELLAREGNMLRSFDVLPWDNGSADVIDHYGVCWYVCCPTQD